LSSVVKQGNSVSHCHIFHFEYCTNFKLQKCGHHWSVLHSNWKNCHSSGKNLLLYLFKKKGTKLDCNTYRGISPLPVTYKILSSILLSKIAPYVEEISGNISVIFYVIYQLLSRYSVFIRCWRKMEI